MLRRKKAARKVARKAAKRVAAPKPLRNVVVTVYFDVRKKEWRVDTPVAYVKPGASVRFKSQKAGPLTLFVPTPGRAASLFPRSRGPVIAVPAKGKRLVVSKARVRRPVTYIYSVYCNKQRVFAAASFPKIIVGP
ncbi:MAG TPA: hypothetical protein VMT19_07290 [Thermoanaerobaculaceae bacterium]|nr:hypothetical protein [Thermoanaerobaculaceae bacterium]